MCGRSYRPRPANGSGDSPRPPFLTEFVNHIGKLTLVEVVYHLFGGQLSLRVHPHVEWSFRLKTEASRWSVELEAANAEVGEQAVHLAIRRPSFVVRKIRESAVNQRDLWPIAFLVFADDRRLTTNH